MKTVKIFLRWRKNLDKISKAIKFAVKAHDGQKRKITGIPSVLHSLEAASIVAYMTSDEDVICASVLHDVAEDTKYALKDIEKRFGKRVAYLVSSETENKRSSLAPETTWKIRKEETLAHLRQTTDKNVKTLWLGDKLSNVRSIYNEYLTVGDDIWKNFHVKDKNLHKWYYESVAEILKKDFADSPFFCEYERLVNKIFKKEQRNEQ